MTSKSLWFNYFEKIMLTKPVRTSSNHLGHIFPVSRLWHWPSVISIQSANLWWRLARRAITCSMRLHSFRFLTGLQEHIGLWLLTIKPVCRRNDNALQFVQTRDADRCIPATHPHTLCPRMSIAYPHPGASGDWWGAEDNAGGSLWFSWSQICQF